MLLKANWVVVVLDKSRPPYSQFSLFQNERQSLLMFVKLLLKHQTKKWKSCGWMRWMGDVTVNGVWITYCISCLFSQSSFLLLTFLFLSLQQPYPPTFLPLVLRRSGLYTVFENNIWLFMSVFALEWVCWTFACIFVLLNVSRACSCLLVCMRFVVCGKNKETDRGSIITCLRMCASVSFLFCGFIFTHLCALSGIIQQ